jgi:hypothetical protein
MLSLFLTKPAPTESFGQRLRSDVNTVRRITVRYIRDDKCQQGKDHFERDENKIISYSMTPCSKCKVGTGRSGLSVLIYLDLDIIDGLG